MRFFMVKMRKYRVNYSLTISNTALQSANNKFELHKKVNEIIANIYKELLVNDELFKNAFEKGKHKIKIDIWRTDEKSK